MQRHRLAMMRGIPAAYQGSRNPLPANARVISEGESLYRTHCAACHGEGGAGDGPAASGHVATARGSALGRAPPDGERRLSHVGHRRWGDSPRHRDAGLQGRARRGGSLADHPLPQDPVRATYVREARHAQTPRPPCGARRPWSRTPCVGCRSPRIPRCVIPIRARSTASAAGTVWNASRRIRNAMRGRLQRTSLNRSPLTPAPVAGVTAITSPQTPDSAAAPVLGRRGLYLPHAPGGPSGRARELSQVRHGPGAGDGSGLAGRIHLPHAPGDRARRPRGPAPSAAWPWSRAPSPSPTTTPSSRT